MRITVAAVAALLSFAVAESAAQSFEPAPRLALGLSPEGMRAMAYDTESELRSLGAFSGKRAVDQFKDPPTRPKGWTVYGRAGIFNFQNRLDGIDGGARFGFRRTGPTLTGRVYLGIHREFQ